MTNLEVITFMVATYALVWYPLYYCFREEQKNPLDAAFTATGAALTAACLFPLVPLLIPALFIELKAARAKRKARS